MPGMERGSRSGRIWVGSVLAWTLLVLAPPPPASGQVGEAIVAVFQVWQQIEKEQREAERWRRVEDIQRDVHDIMSSLEAIEGVLLDVLEELQQLSVQIDQRFDRERHEQILAVMSHVRKNLWEWSRDPKQHTVAIQGALRDLQQAVAFAQLTDSLAGYLYISAAMPTERTLLILLEKPLETWAVTFLDYARYFEAAQDVEAQGSIGYAYRVVRVRMDFIEREHQANGSGWCRKNWTEIRCVGSERYARAFTVERRWLGSLEQGYSWTGERRTTRESRRTRDRCSDEPIGSGPGNRFLVAPVQELLLLDEPEPDWSDKSYWSRPDDETPVPRHSCFDGLKATRTEHARLRSERLPLLEAALSRVFAAEVQARQWAQGPDPSSEDAPPPLAPGPPAPPH